jgi:hypothetical protein
MEDSTPISVVRRSTWALARGKNFRASETFEELSVATYTEPKAPRPNNFPSLYPYPSKRSDKLVSLIASKQGGCMGKKGRG